MAKRALETQYLRLNSGITTCTLAEVAIGSPKSVLGTPQLANHPPSVAETCMGLGTKVEHPVRIVDLVQVPGDPDRQVGKVDRLHRVLEDRLPALAQEELAAAPDVQLLLLLDDLQLLLERVLGELGQQLRRLPALEDRHRLVPVADLFLEPADLLVALPTDRTELQEVGGDLAQDLLVLQAVREPQRQHVERQMGILHILLLLWIQKKSEIVLPQRQSRERKD